MKRDRSSDDLLIAALAGLVPDQPPAPDVSARIRDRLMARIEGEGMRVLRADAGAWEPFLPGVLVKRLRSDASDGTETTLWRLSPGAKIPTHGHRLDEECLVIDGSVIHDGIEYRAGDFLLAPAGMRHAVFHSPSGATLLIRGEKLPVLSRGLHE